MDLDPATLLSAYAQGVFPMADERGRLGWYTADPRGVLPLERFHVPQTLLKLMRQDRFEVRINSAFEQTMRACMEARAGHTWITPGLVAAYVRLHELGRAHSVEVWHKGDLAGGLYGVSLGGAFFGESMFHRKRDASKVALVALVQRLRSRGFALLDAQTCTPHLARFGFIAIPAEGYLKELKKAIGQKCTFD